MIYESGKPGLYINGKLAEKAESSGLVVHPGWETKPSEEQYTGYFEGNMTDPKLFDKVLSETEILAQYEKGISDSELPSGITIGRKPDGKMSLLIWENGNYRINTPPGTIAFSVSEITESRLISGPWQLRFPDGLGAPKETTLPRLTSLHKHEHFGVNHFSRTLSYHKTIIITPSETGGGKRLFLDLGRVEVIAEVKLNGKNIGNFWKELFLVEFTEDARVGANELEIRVTNLWANRLIVDESAS